MRLEYLNTQGQPKMVWPKTFSLARAYLDQLDRSRGLDAARISAIRAELASAEKGSETERRNALARLAAQVEGDMAGAGDRDKVGMLAGVVREMSTSPSLAQAN